MGEGDYTPHGGQHHRTSDPKRIEQLKQGYAKAKEITKKERQHHELEASVAETEFEKNLEELSPKNKNNHKPKND